MIVLGINAYHADASACVVRDGQLIAAVAEERFNRHKHSAGFPSLAIRWCLDSCGILPEEVDHVAISRDPSAHLHQQVLNQALNVFPRTITVKDRLASVGKKRSVEKALCKALSVQRSALRATFHNVEHHRAHLASAFFLSPFDDAAILSVDGFGDFVSTMTGRGSENSIDVMDWIEYPHSLGLFYTATTQYLGFPQYGDEGKVMGLASYGTPTYLDAFRDIVRLRPHGRFELNLDYFTHHSHGVQMLWDTETPELVPVWSSKFADTFGPARKPGDLIEERHQNVAASLQAMLEEALEHVCRHLHAKVPVDRLCLAGGVGLNCRFNGLIRQTTPFKDVFIQPAAGDDGTAIGAAYYVYHQVLRQPRVFEMRHAFTGPAYSDNEISAVVVERGLTAEMHPSAEDLVRCTAQLIAEGLVIGWVQGPMEFGPRALGHRSILVDPRRPDMREVLNQRIKQRETFRPFASSILDERVGDYFDQDYPSPFMLMAYNVRPERRSEVPAITHRDGTGRIQTVDRETGGIYWQLLKAFDDLTGTPLLLNTSFNENEPIVCSPSDAIDCFLKTRMDVLVMGNYILRKPASVPMGPEV